MLTRTVDDMYNVSSKNNTKLLSEYGSDFWQNYIQNYVRYDKLFRRYYRQFRYFMQEDDETIDEITTNFTEDVYNHLLINDKKYSELYRVNVVDDDEYHILGNYDIKETMERNNENTASDTLGSRNDITNYSQGQQDNVSKTAIEGFNSDSFSDSDLVNDTIGSRADSTDMTKGVQNNTHTGNDKETYTMSRVGNIGIMTGTDMLRKHSDYWTYYEFYTYIFREIAKELLLA